MMNIHAGRERTKLSYKILSAFIAFTFSFTSVVPPSYAQSIASLNLPTPGVMVTPSAAFVPVLLKGMTIHPDNPLQFDFIIDSGNTNFKEDQIKTESERLVKYFLASMTIPKDDLWVNLSPYEKDRIIPDELGKTELGRDMLAQDYILKQLTASLMYPEKELGKEFWNKVYKQAQEKFGTTEIPVDTFNKVWILPETATVYEHGQTVYIVDAKLRVMLDQDYVAGNVGAPLVGARDKAGTSPAPTGNNISTSIIREIILPEIEREVNEGRNFAPLRQIYHSLILAKWYKETIKNSLLSKIYIDQKKIAGVNTDDPTLKDQIYAQYMEAYKKGVFNYIKEDYDRLSREVIPRKYFSGGIDRLTNFSLIKLDKTSNPARVAFAKVGRHFALTTAVDPQKDGAAIPKKSSSPMMAKELKDQIAEYRKIIMDSAKSDPERNNAKENLESVLAIIRRDIFLIEDQLNDGRPADPTRVQQIDNLIAQIRSWKFELRGEAVDVLRKPTEDQVNALRNAASLKDGEAIIQGLKLKGTIDRDIAEKGLGYFHQTANAFILTPEVKILNQVRVPWKKFGLFESIYGGHLSAGQGHVTGILRELLEELGFLGKQEDLSGELKFAGFDVFEDPKGDNKEVRSLFVYKLTPAEWSIVENEIAKLKKARETAEKSKVRELNLLPESKEYNGALEKFFKKSLSAEKSGLGEVWDIKIVTWDQLDDVSKLENYTPDLLRPIMQGDNHLKKKVKGLLGRNFDANRTRRELKNILYELQWWTNSPFFTWKDAAVIRAVEKDNALAGPGVDNYGEDLEKEIREHDELSKKYNDAIETIESVINSRINEIIKWAEQNFANFNNEEVLILDGENQNANVIGRIDREIAEKFGFNYRESDPSSSPIEEKHHLPDAELRLLREANEGKGFISKRGFDENRVRKQLVRILSNIQWWEKSPLLTQEDKTAIRQVEEQNFLAGPGTGDEHYMEAERYQDMVKSYNTAVEKRRLLRDEKVAEVINWAKLGKNFKGEEVHILDGVGKDGKVIGRIDRNIAEKFGFIHETANAVILTPDRNKVITSSRAHNKMFGLDMTIYGGHLGVGQWHKEGIIKELKEELGLSNLKGKLDLTGYDAYDQSQSGISNRERRSLFIYVLEKDEYKVVLERKKMLEEAKSRRTENEFEQWIEEQQRNDGEGEVWSVHEVILDDLIHAPQQNYEKSPLFRNESVRFIETTDRFVDGDIIRKAFFTPDLLNPLLNNDALMQEIKNRLTGGDGSADQYSPSTPPQSSSPVFMDEMKERAKELGIPLGDNTKIAVFIGGKQILSDHYYQMFKEVVRGNFGFDLVYLPFVIDGEGADVDTEARIRMIKEQLADNPRVVGAVVTRPWKEHFFVTGDSKSGAINYIVKDRDGRLQRMVTDGQAWLDGLNDDLKARKSSEDPYKKYDFQNKKIVILGSGGSARELADTLNGQLQGDGAKITFTDKAESKMKSLEEALYRLNPSYRTAFLASEDLTGLRRAVREADILINATGIGRGETEGQSPLLPHLFAEAKHDLIVIDLISNTDTQMLKDARQTGPEGIKTFNGRAMYIQGMTRFIEGWMTQIREGEQVIPSDDKLYQAVAQSEFTPPEIFQMVWSRFGYSEYPYHSMGDFISKITKLREEGKVRKISSEEKKVKYDVGKALKDAIVFTGSRIVPNVYIVDSDEQSFGAEWMDRSFGLPEEEKERGIYIEQSLLDYIKDKEDPADMLTRVFVHVLTSGSIVKKRKAQFEYAKARFPRLVHHLLDPVNGGEKNIEQVLWEVRDSVLGLATAGEIKDYLGDVGVPYTIEEVSVEKQQEIKRHAEELADIAESALHKIAINALNKTIDLSIYQRMHLKEHEMTGEDSFSFGMLAYAANPPTFAHVIVAALKAMAESNSDIFYVSATFADFRKDWLHLTFEKRQSISTRLFRRLSGGLVRVMERLPQDDGLNGEEKVLPILDRLNGAGRVNVWYGAGDDHYFAFALDKKTGKVKLDKIVTEGDKRNYKDFLYYVDMPGYRKLLKKLLLEHPSMIPEKYIPAVEAIVGAKNPVEMLKEGAFFPVLDTVGKLWILQEEINARKKAGRYSTDFTLGMVNTLRLGVRPDALRQSLKFPTIYNAGASFEIAATVLREGVAHLIETGRINLKKFEAMCKDVFRELLSPTTGDREYLYSLVQLDKGLISAKAVQTLFPLDKEKEDARHKKLRDKLLADLSVVVPNAVVSEDSDKEENISKITVSDAGRMNDLIEYTYSVDNGLYTDGRGKEIVLVVNIRSREDMPAQSKKAIIKAIKSYVYAYNYADGFMEIQDTLIKDLVRRDKNKSELSSEDADVIMIAGNDDLNVYREALYLISRGIGRHLLISGGVGRLRDDIKKAAEDAGFENITQATEAGMIRNIMVQMAERAQQPDLVEKLNDDNFVILEDKAAFTVQNFNFAKQKLIENGLLGDRQEPALKVLYMHKPLQQLRAKGNFHSVFFSELETKKIAGVSYTTNYSKNPNTPGDIVGEYFRIIANYQKKGEEGREKIGDWEFKDGLKSIPENLWEYALLLFKELTPEEKQKLVDAMYANIKDMKVDDRTVLYKNLSPAAKALAEAVYGYGQSSPAAPSSSPVTQQGTGDRVQGSETAKYEVQTTKDDKLGGIDMNSIDLERQGVGVDIRFDPAELQNLLGSDIDGFAPVIINIVPLPSVLPLLGLEPRKEEDAEELSRVN